MSKVKRHALQEHYNIRNNRVQDRCSCLAHSYPVTYNDFLFALSDQGDKGEVMSKVKRRALQEHYNIRNNWGSRPLLLLRSQLSMQTLIFWVCGIKKWEGIQKSGCHQSITFWTYGIKNGKEYIKIGVSIDKDTLCMWD